MGERVGRETNLTSHELKRVYQALMNGDNDSYPDYSLCDMTGCKGGFRHNNITDKTEPCPKCKSWGVIKKV